MWQAAGRRLTAGVAIVALALLLVPTTVPSPSVAQERSEDAIERELREARERAERTGSELDDLEGDLAAARDDLARLTRDLANARAQLRAAEGQLALAGEAATEAETARAAAVRNLELAEQLLGNAEEQLASEESDLFDQVATTYKYGSAGRGVLYLRVIRQAQSPNDVATGLYKLGSVIDHQDRAVERVTGLRDERADLRSDADATRSLALERERDAAQTLELLERLREEAARITVAITADEREQRRILDSLEADAATQRRVLDAAEEAAGRLEEDFAEARQARVAAGGFVCPVTPAWFQNDWGFPRSGGRSHEGTDVFADRDTPIVAVAAGTIRALDADDRYRPGTSRGDLGGISLSYWTAPSEYWYFSHLERLEPGLSVGQRVTAGQVIGYIGNSGNARTTPTHTHVGRYVGGSATNPFPALDGACR